MKSKIIISTLLAFVLMISVMGTVNARIDSVTYTDNLGDVRSAVANVSEPNLDIKEIICSQSGSTITLTLNLNNSGVIRNTSSVGYLILLSTSINQVYYIYYGDLSLSEGGSEEGVVDSIVQAYSDEDLENQDFTDISHIYSGIGTNSLTFEFDLLDEDEHFINLVSTVFETIGITDFYMDELNLDYVLFLLK